MLGSVMMGKRNGCETVDWVSITDGGETGNSKQGRSGADLATARKLEYDNIDVSLESCRLNENCVFSL
jgi:hypothetical protein